MVYLVPGSRFSSVFGSKLFTDCSLPPEPTCMRLWTPRFFGSCDRRHSVGVSAGSNPCGPQVVARGRMTRPELVAFRRRCYCGAMTLKGRVKAGRLVVDEPTDLPEGTEIELLPLDPGDWLDAADRATLHDALRASDEDVKSGRLADADAILRELRSR